MAQVLDDWRERWWAILDWYDEVSSGRKAVAVVCTTALLAGIGFWQLGSGSESEEPGSASEEEAGDDPYLSWTKVQIAETIATSDGDSFDGDPVATADTSGSPSTSLSAASTVPLADRSVAPASASTSVPAETSRLAVANNTPGAGGSSVPAETSLDYPTSPDGAPLPLVVVFDTETITISGQVPSQAAKDRLAALAKANSQSPDAEVIDNMVVNPAVPISVGARVIELNSARFPEGTADILPDHARELDRVANIMNALPNISVLVVGHADQRGDDLSNFAISDERARAVVNYLIYLGIAPARLASRAAGEADLLTLDDDDASLALNRRTEFIFGGLLIE